MRSVLDGVGHLAAAEAVRRLPPALATRLRATRPSLSPAGAVHRLVLEGLRRGGIPPHVRTFRLAGQPELRFVRADSLVLAQLYWFGSLGWEPELVRWWRHLCAQSRVILELGANVGYFTVQGARAAPGARYIAVEPHPASVEVCRANLELNGVRSVELVPAAAVGDDHVGSVRIRIPSDQLASPTVAFVAEGSELPAAMASDVNSVLEVPAVAIGTLIDGADLVKLDVEGQEHVLLRAAFETLVARRPTVFVELLPGTARLREVIIELCRAANYSCYAPLAAGLAEIRPDRIPSARLREEYGTNDVILSVDPALPRALG